MSVAKLRAGGSAERKVTRGSRKPKPVLITGGAGFIGINLANRLLSDDQPVLLFDNLSRPGVKQNWEWIVREHGNLVETAEGDVRDFEAVSRVVARASKIFHFAGQTAVAASLENPMEDFEINARGTLNVLEAIRKHSQPPPLLYTSTNKMYGAMADLTLRSSDRRYEPDDPLFRLNGFNESRPLHFHSPYGCSKGAACQYVLDYARTYRLPATVFCLSCSYGPHQLGTENQGWVAHFLARAMKGASITIFGDGKQVRDILFVDDLVEALLLGHQQMARLAGQCFNIGGGPENTISLIELVEVIKELRQVRPRINFKPWRLADQRYYVSDIRKFCRATGWCPSVGVREGIERLYRWLETEAKAPAQMAA